MTFRPHWLVVASLCFFAPSARAEEARMVDGPRVVLRDIVESAPAEVADTDVGPAPPAGSSRLFGRDEIVQALQRAGVEAQSVTLPSVVRVIRSARRLSAIELAAEARSVLARELPKGAKLVSVSAQRGAVVPKRAELTAVRLAKLPRRTGRVTLSATAELSDEGGVVARVPIRTVLDIGENAIHPDVARGARVELVIERNGARISAAAVALADGDVGDVVSFKVEHTHKVLRGKIETGDRARVVAR